MQNRNRSWVCIALILSSIGILSGASLPVSNMMISSPLSMFGNPAYAQDARNKTDKLFDKGIPSAVREAAQKGLPIFLNTIPKEDLLQYHFFSKEEFAVAALGEPFQVYTIPPEKILTYDGKSSILDMISASSQWLFPVIVRNESRTILAVDFIGGKWRAVEIGGGLAKPWAAVLKSWPFSSGYKHFYVRVLQAMSEFVVLLNSGKITIMPLESAVISLGIERGKPIETPSMVSHLRKPVLDNINRFKK